MIALSTAHAAERAAAALQATLAALDAGTTGASIALYATTRPAVGDVPGAEPLAIITLPQPAGAIEAGVLTLAPVGDALIMSTGVAAWARVSENGATLFDCDVSDTTGTATIRLATTQLYAGGSVRLASGVLG
jgi:hypothetical protein